MICAVFVTLNKALKYSTLKSVLFALITSDLNILQSELPFNAKSRFLLLESWLLMSYSFFIIYIDP